VFKKNLKKVSPDSYESLYHGDPFTGGSWKHLQFAFKVDESDSSCVRTMKQYLRSFYFLIPIIAFLLPLIGFITLLIN